MMTESATRPGCLTDPSVSQCHLDGWLCFGGPVMDRNGKVELERRFARIGQAQAAVDRLRPMVGQTIKCWAFEDEDGPGVAMQMSREQANAFLGPGYLDRVFSWAQSL